MLQGVKSHATQGLLGICVSWTPHFKEIVASTIPGLTPPPPDFFLWRHLKDTVYLNHPYTLQELQANIQRTVAHCKTCSLTLRFLSYATILGG
jgi:hypothetical protein